MKLHRLGVTNFKGVATRAVTFPTSGVIVLEGPNEVGKTSMIEALDLLLEEKDSSKKREVLAMQPVDRDVESVIEAEISTGPYRFTYRKQWFKRPATELTITEPKLENLTGLAAHDRVRSMLAETTDLVLWKALRLVQATPLLQDDFSASTALTTALDRAAGQNRDAGAAGESLVQAVEATFTTYFTARAGTPTGEFKAAAERLAQARQALALAQAAVREVEQDIELHERCVSDLHDCELELAEARTQANALGEQWNQVSALVDEADQASKAAVDARHAHERAVERYDERIRTVKELADGERQFEELADRARALSEALAPLADELARHASDLASAQATEAASRTSADRAAQDVEHLRQADALTALSVRLIKIDDASRQRAQESSRLARLPVDQALLGKVEKAHTDLQMARVEQSAASAQFTVTGLADGQVLQIDGEQVSLGSGQSLTRSVSERLEATVPGSLLFAIEPESGAAKRAATVAAKSATLREALDEAAVADLAGARDAYEMRREAAEAKRRAEEQYASLLDGEDLEDLRDKHRTLADSVSTYAEQRESDLPLPTDQASAAGAAQAAQDEHAAARTEVARLTTLIEAARSTVEDRRVELARTEAQLEATQGHLESQRSWLAKQRETSKDAELAAQVAVLLADRTDKEDLRDALAARLQGYDPDSLKVRKESAEAALPRWEKQRQSLHDKRVGIEARLEHTGSQGRQELLDAAEADLEHQQRAHDAIDRRARAARLLRETLQRHRSEAQRAYVEPFANAVTRLGRVVFGPDFAVEVSQTLGIEARILDGRRIEFGALSSGAKEQLAVITRLACSSLVDADHGVPVVIDDALGYSDPDRLKRISAAFSLLGSDAQVILLTCTRGRYAAIAAAEAITL